MRALERVQELLAERKWTAYKLAKESGLPQSTITNLFSRNYDPSIATLEAVCRGLGITMSQFFAEGELVELSEEQYQFFSDWAVLSPEDKLLIAQLVKKLKTAKYGRSGPLRSGLSLCRRVLVCHLSLSAAHRAAQYQGR